MNLKKGKFKIVEGTRVRMVSSKDTHIVEGAYGTVVSPGIRESEVRWDSMLAIRADYRYRNELEDALIIPVYNDLLDPSGNYTNWTPVSVHYKDVKTGLRAKWELLSKSLKLCSLPQTVNRLLI